MICTKDEIDNYRLTFICNRAGFCSIRENIRACLVSPWVFWLDLQSRQNSNHGSTKLERPNSRASLVEPKYPWRDQRSPDIFPNRAKTCTITCLSSLTEKCILKTKLSRLEKLHSCVNARTHQFSALGRPHSFKR